MDVVGRTLRSGSVNLEEFVAWFTGGCPLEKKKEQEQEQEQVTEQARERDDIGTEAEDDVDEAEALVAAEVLSEINVD